MPAPSRRAPAPRLRKSPGRLTLLLTLAGTLAFPAHADRIVLKNGRVIEADRVWVQGKQAMYEKNGGIFGLPMSLVQSLDQRAAPVTTLDPDVLQARALLARGDVAEAARLLQRVVVRDPLSLAGLQELAEAQSRLGNGHAARQAAAQALKIEERNARSNELMGDALALLADRVGAEAAYSRSLLLRPDPRVHAKRDGLSVLPGPVVAVPSEVTAAPSLPNPQGTPLGRLPPPPPAALQPTGAQLRLRYDGGVNEPLGGAVLEAASSVYAEYVRRFGLNPESALTILLQTDAAFQEGGTPAWAAGMNDGTIRLPVRGLVGATPAVVRVLRHELAHSFVGARTGGNCPTWLQEGIAQWLEGGDPYRADASLLASARTTRLLPLLSLEGPFQDLLERDAQRAYAQSLSAVAFILARRGEPGLMRLLAALGDGLPSEEALPVALALSYPEFQREWEASLKSAAAR